MTDSHHTSSIVFNGDLIPAGAARVHVLTPAMKYGLSVFEGLRAYPDAAGRQLNIFKLQPHIDRLYESMKLIRMQPTFTPAELSQQTVAVMRKNGLKEPSHIRIMCFVDGAGEMEAAGPVSYVIAALERPRIAGIQHGIRCQVSAWARISDQVMPPRIKCAANYINGRLARQQAQADGYDEAIILTGRGTVAEAPGACLFLVRRGVLITPDVTSSILESITRDTVIQLAREAGIPLAERPVDRTELYVADEVFLVGSAAEVLPVVGIDGLPVGAGEVGPLTQQLQALYFSTVSGQRSVPSGWLHPVYDSQP